MPAGKVRSKSGTTMSHAKMFGFPSRLRTTHSSPCRTGLPDHNDKVCLLSRSISAWTTPKGKQLGAKRKDSETVTKSSSWTSCEDVLQGAYEPHTNQEESQVYGLTLKTTTESIFRARYAMREQRFPKRSNRMPAYVALFHVLSHSQIETMVTKIVECECCIGL
ncbi:hypothetical protein K504DRAFT_461183 [Pleomassaria siparia CBS 279.74]|uniref:Uncharacterized protein n=1 Tax=Pleomassaria siparia CBS 279.74 TaxID=1314801 RepID=A0A6G1JVR5_9PLEO|nr:hypothetical protein K504DRAFT_461183 [Pleomassaria siparia CBS 279.74]